EGFAARAGASGGRSALVGRRVVPARAARERAERTHEGNRDRDALDVSGSTVTRGRNDPAAPSSERRERREHRERPAGGRDAGVARDAAAARRSGVLARLAPDERLLRRSDVAVL